jgi:hypothetical protein
MALSMLALLIVAAANATPGPPPVCPVVKCTPSEFGARTKVYQCPKAFPSDAPVEALLDCMPSSQHSLNCKVFPTEVPPACGSSGANLVYDWTVRVGMSEYPYPPSYNNTLSVSCMGLERVFVSVTVWNGSYSSTDSFGMTCGDDPR